MDAALVLALIGALVLLSFVSSAVALLFLRSVAIRRQEDDEMDALTWSRERRDAMRRARWVAGVKPSDLPPTRTIA